MNDKISILWAIPATAAILLAFVLGALYQGVPA